MIYSRKKGFSLLEMIVVLAIFGVIVSAISVMNVSSNRIYTQLQTQSINQLDREIFTREVSFLMRSAIEVLPTRTFGSTLYATSTNTLIISLPGIDEQGRSTGTAMDHAVVYQDTVNPNELKMEIFPDPLSNRQARARTISTNLNTSDKARVRASR